MNVCFFRHGIAAEHGDPRYAEDERPLTGEGRRRTRQAARGLARLKLGLDAILTSPLPRAAQTAEILADVLGLPEPRPSDRLLPSATPARLLGLLREAKAKSPVLVGHEPLLSAAASLLVSADESASLELRKAGMAFAQVRTLAPAPRGTLLLLLSPAVLRRLDR